MIIIVDSLKELYDYSFYDIRFSVHNNFHNCIINFTPKQICIKSFLIDVILEYFYTWIPISLINFLERWHFVWRKTSRSKIRHNNNKKNVDLKKYSFMLTEQHIYLDYWDQMDSISPYRI